MKLTELDRIEYCKDHSCESCEYMNGYCHIQEDMEETCIYCELERSCRKCGYAINHKKNLV